MDKMRKLAMVSDFDQVKAGSPGVEAEVVVAKSLQIRLLSQLGDVEKPRAFRCSSPLGSSFYFCFIWIFKAQFHICEYLMYDN